LLVAASVTLALAACGTAAAPPNSAEPASASAAAPSTAADAVADPGPTGSLAGRITFRARVPAPVHIRLTGIFADNCGSDSSATVAPPVDPSSHGLREAFVIVDAPGVRPALPFELRRFDCAVAPPAQVVSPDSPLSFVHSSAVSDLNDPPRFHRLLWWLPNGDLDSFYARESRTISRDPTRMEGLHRIGCIVHGWEQAAFYATRSPHAAVTDTVGRFRIDGIPVGTHTVHVVNAWLFREVAGLGTAGEWLPSTKVHYDRPRRTSLDVTISASSVTPLEIDLGDVAPESAPATASPPDASAPESP
jgi:hypothetical protein